MRTDSIDINGPDKSTWWKVDLGVVYNIHSINILFKNYGFGMYIHVCTVMWIPIIMTKEMQSSQGCKFRCMSADYALNFFPYVEVHSKK